MPIQIFIARHASPDRTRTDIRYDLPPGPSLSPKGEAEAQELGRFLRTMSVARLYASPMERAWRTAQLAGDVLGMQFVVEEAIGEWAKGETKETVAARLLPFWEKVCVESEQHGSACLITHGGPLRLLLRRLGMPREDLESLAARFDRKNPAPPAGVWRAKTHEAGSPWELDLVFVPRSLAAI